MNSTLRFQRQRLSARLRQEASLLARVFQITRVSLKFLFLVFVADPIRRRFTKSGAPSRPLRLRQFFEAIGGSFLKLGQMVALQPDMIPVEFCDELMDLMDRIPPFDYATAERIFQEESGRNLLDVFEQVDPTPLATASIGQVHVAYLNGHKVAIKLQRPEAESLVTSDVRVASALVRFIRTLSVKPLYWLLEPLSEFIRWSREELDFQYEARYTQQALDNARGEPSEKVPNVYWEWTSRRALVIEFLEGITVLDYLRKREDEQIDQSSILPEGYSNSDFCTNVVENFLGGAFNCGLFHADLHPGNLMIMKDSTVGYIDFGITGILSDYSRTNLIGLTLAYAQGDIDQMLKSFIRVSTINSNSDLAKLELGLRRRAEHWYKNESGKSTSITSMMLDWLNLSKESEVWPQRDVIKYIRCSVVMDGLIKRLDPNFDIGAALATAARGHLEAGLRRNIFSYERVFEAFASSSDLVSGGPSAVRTAFTNLARAMDLPVKP